MTKKYTSRLGDCLQNACDNKRFSGGLCRKHYDHRDKPTGEPGNYSSQGVCIEKQCQKKRHARGRCSFHYYHYNNDQRKIELMESQTKAADEANDFWEFVKTTLKI